MPSVPMGSPFNTDPVPFPNPMKGDLVGGPVQRYIEFMDERVGGEQRVVDPNTGGEKGTKLARFDLIPPDILWELAEHYGTGAEKYADRNWQRGYSWSLSYAALERHLKAFWNGEDIDDESGERHIIAALWHCVALAWFQKHHPEGDDRWKP